MDILDQTKPKLRRHSMTRKNKVSGWMETAFQSDSELWRIKTTEGMVVLGRLPDGIFTLHRFNG